MFDTATLLIFVTASLLLIVAPGPDIVFLVAQGATRGARAGFVTAMGLAAGNLVHTVAAALGISVVFQTSAVAFNLVKFAGAAYLLYLAWKMMRSGGDAIEMKRDSEEPKQSLFWRGFLMNVLNPKVALFFLAFLPQFASPSLGPVWLQMLFYGVFFTVMVVLVFGTLGIFAGHLSQGLARSAAGRIGKYLKWLVSGVFVLLAVRLATVQR